VQRHTTEVAKQTEWRKCGRYVFGEGAPRVPTRVHGFCLLKAPRFVFPFFLQFFLFHAFLFLLSDADASTNAEQSWLRAQNIPDHQNSFFSRHAHATVPFTTMHEEIAAATEFLTSVLVKHNPLPESALLQFKSQVRVDLETRFAGHWYPGMPNKGSAYRCLQSGCGRIDPLLLGALTKCQLSTPDHFRSLTIWIDPGEVSLRLLFRLNSIDANQFCTHFVFDGS
jgi:hypothetical protein